LLSLSEGKTNPGDLGNEPATEECETDEHVPKLRFSTHASQSEASGMEVLMLTQVKEHYRIRDQIGEGGFGKVYKVQKKSNRKLYALKTITVPDYRSTEDIEREVATASEFDHPYVLTLHAYFKEGRTYHLVFDLCSGGNLAEYVQEYVQAAKQYVPNWDSGGLPTKVVAKYTWMMLDGLHYLHHYGFVHRDIKPHNYLRRTNAVDAPLKLADFGMCQRIQPEETLSGKMGTVGFMAPEVIHGRYNQKADVFSLGLTIFAIGNDSVPNVTKESEMVAALNQAILKHRRWCIEMPQLHAMVISMLRFDPDARPTIKDLITEHAWLKKHCKASPEGGCCVVS